MPPKSRTPRAATTPPVETYRHSEATSLLRPDVGTQAQFKKKKPPKQYRYDSSLSPALDWDGNNSARELGDWLLNCVERASRLEPPQCFEKRQEFMDGHGKVIATVTGLQDAVEALQRLSGPFLDWSGKGGAFVFLRANPASICT